MTQTDGYRALRDRIAPILAEAAEGVIERDHTRALPREAVAALAAAGLGRARVPAADGGYGLTIPEFADVLVEIATVDANLPQVFRGHIAWVEEVLLRPASPWRDEWIGRLVAGEIVGNAWSETGSGALGTQQTVLGDTLTGKKYYSTGSIYADWIDVVAQRGDEQVGVLVPTAQDGVTVSDDWDGFGQRGTGTGTATFDAATVDAGSVAPVADRFGTQTALYQLVLLTVLAGIAAAAEHDTAAALRSRSRVYSHGTADRASADPQLLQVVGEVSATAFAARAVVRDAAAAVAETLFGGSAVGDADAIALAEIRTAQGQIALTDSVPRAATRLFDALGASGTSSATALDRHWRNARTVASHNPWVYKARIVGDWSVNGNVSDPLWAIGVATP